MGCTDRQKVNSLASSFWNGYPKQISVVSNKVVWSNLLSRKFVSLFLFQCMSKIQPGKEKTKISKVSKKLTKKKKTHHHLPFTEYVMWILPTHSLKVFNIKLNAVKLIIKFKQKSRFTLQWHCLNQILRTAASVILRGVYGKWNERDISYLAFCGSAFTMDDSNPLSISRLRGPFQISKLWRAFGKLQNVLICH